MSGKLPFVALLFACVGSWAECLPLEKTAEGTVFGDCRLSVTFASADGWPSAVSVEGERVMVRDGEYAAPFALNVKKADLAKALPKPKFMGVTRIGEDSARADYRVGDWRFAVMVKLFPVERMVRRQFAFAWDGASPTGRLDGVWASGGKVLCSAAKGRYFLPGCWPLVHYEVPFHDGWRQSVGGGRSGGPAPLVGEGGGRWSVLACLDETADHADRGETVVRTRKDGFSVSTDYQTCGRMPKGVEQTVGDAWYAFTDGDAEAALRAMPKWFERVGQTIPPDRAKWLRDAVLYSTHPRGSGDENMMDKGGFKAAADYLPVLKGLGVNTIWLRPVEDESCYVPRDYYSLQKGIGSAADFRAYVDRAHALGIRVIRDAVIHGGRSDARNPRAITHPEWVGRYEDGSVADFWCFDFNWPTWVDYMGEFIRHDTAYYALDGWRLDAPSGSRHPNWNPEIPYARASFAQLKGAKTQVANIRRQARAARPGADAATLTESHLSAFATIADSIYDEWCLAERFGNAILCDGAAKAVKDMRRWFHEQQLAFVPDTINMRYVDNHDTITALNRLGRAPATAMMALMSWTTGFPQILNETEDGAFEQFRGIFRTRAALDELRNGTADYLSPETPDGVFACIRESAVGKSVVLVNFNPTPVRTEWAALDPYGYAVVRLRGRSVAEELGETKPFAGGRGDCPRAAKFANGLTFDLEVGGGRKIPVVAELREWTNGDVRVAYRLERVKTERGWRIRLAELEKGRTFYNLKLIVRVPTAERWYVRAAEGLFESPYGIRHPDYDEVGPHTSGQAYRNGALRWDSKHRPFGLDRDHAAAGAVCGETAVELSGFPKTGLRVYDRLGRENGLAFQVYGPDLAAYAVDLDIRPAAEALTACPGTGDDRLRIVPGGYEFEEGTLRVRVRNNGALAAVWRKRDGRWIKVAGEAGFSTNTGTGRKVNTGEIPSLCQQKNGFEVPHRISRDGQGRVRLEFTGGELRSMGRHSSRMAQPIFVDTSYTFGGDESFRLRTTMTTTRPLAKDSAKDANLVWELHHADDHKAIEIGEIDWLGVKPRETPVYGNKRLFVWLGRNTPDFDPPKGSRNGFSATVRVGAR